MSVGERLSALRPEERRSEHRVKEAVHQAAAEIAQEYLAEIAPFIGPLEIERLFRILPGNVLAVTRWRNSFSITASRREARKSTSSARSTAWDCSATSITI